MSIEQTARPAESRPAAAPAHGAAAGRSQPADGGVGASFLALLGAMEVTAEDLTPQATTPGDDPMATGMTPRHGRTDKGGRRDARASQAATDGSELGTPDGGDSLATDEAPGDAPVTPVAAAAPADTPAPWPVPTAWDAIPTTVPQAALPTVPAAPQSLAPRAAPEGEATLSLDSSTRAPRAPVAVPVARAAEGPTIPATDASAAGAAAAARQESATAAGGARAASQRMAGQALAAADAQASQRSQQIQQALQQQAQAATPASLHAAAREGLSPESMGAALAGALAAATAEPQLRGAARGADRLDEPRGGPVPGLSAEGAHSRHALSADAALPVATAPIDTGATNLDDRMDAQVSWWMSQKTQNAELTLDTADGRQVEVSIAMNGNEAQVQFRAEQASTRELLGSALGQLQDSLGREGVVLAGVTVDSFASRGQGDAPSGDSARQGARTGGARRTMSIGGVDGTGAAPAARAPQGATARGLDLYV